MNLLHPITKIMTTDLHVLSAHSSIAEAARLFAQYKIHHIPVVEGGSLLGIISKSDYLFFRRGFGENTHDDKKEEIRLNNFMVSQIMTKGVATMEPTDKINVAIEIFKENLFHAIPVTQYGQLIGMVTTYDIINQLGIDNSAVAEYELSYS